MGIAFGLHVTWGNDAIEPGISFAADGGLPVIETISPEDPGFGIVGSLDGGAAMDDSVWLVEVDCSLHVFRDDGIILPRLCDTIDLDRQHYRDADAIQFAREDYRGRAAPAVADEHDVRSGFFIVAQHAVMVRIQQVKDGFEGCLAMAVLENLDVNIFGGILLKKPCDLDGVVVRIVVAEESADETDKDVSGRLRISDASAFGCEDRWTHDCEQEEHRNKRTGSNETVHAEFLTDKMTQLGEGMRQKPKCKLNRVPKKAISPQALAGKAFGLFQPVRQCTPVVKGRLCAGMVLGLQG